VFVGIQGAAIYIEEGFGPHLIDNNVFIGKGIDSYSSQAAVCVHNLFYNSGNGWGADNSRSASYWNPHTITRMGSKLSPPSMDRWYNNIFVGTGLANATTADFKIDYNVYLQGATKSPLDANSVVNSYSTGLTYKSDSTGASITFNMNNLPWTVLTPLITTAYIGNIAACGRGPENPDGSAITVDKDFFGNARNTTHPLPGPFETMVQGANTLQLFTLYNGQLIPTGIAGDKSSLTKSQATTALFGNITKMQNRITVDVVLPASAIINLSVFDLKGKALAIPLRKAGQAGINHIILPAGIPSNGAYIVKLNADDRGAAKKIIL
jgi:hypothetical protein